MDDSSIFVGLVSHGQIFSWLSALNQNFQMFVDDGELLVSTFVVIINDKLSLIVDVLAHIEYSASCQRLNGVELLALLLFVGVALQGDHIKSKDIVKN